MTGLAPQHRRVCTMQNDERPGGSAAPSDVDQLESATGCGRELFDVGTVGGDDGSPPADARFGHSRIDRTDRVRQRPTKRAGTSGVLGRECFDLASIEQARQAGLSTTAPGLDDASGWHHRKDSTLHRSRMERPHAPIICFGGDERSGVVHEAERRECRPSCRHQCRPTPTRSRSRSATASSSAVSAPCWRSQARTARKPRRVASHRPAASARAAETVRPSSAACSSRASKTSAGSEMDRFTTDDMRSWYDHSMTVASACRTTSARAWHSGR